MTRDEKRARKKARATAIASRCRIAGAKAARWVTYTLTGRHPVKRKAA